jgi:hypothetical protein
MTELFGTVWPVIRVGIHYFRYLLSNSRTFGRTEIGMVAADISKYKQGKAKIWFPDKT